MYKNNIRGFHRHKYSTNQNFRKHSHDDFFNILIAKNILFQGGAERFFMAAILYPRLQRDNNGHSRDERLLFVLGFNISLTLFQSYCDCTCMRQVIVLPHWNALVEDTWQEHSTKSHYKLTPSRPAIFPSTRLSIPSVNKAATHVLVPSFYEFWYIAARDWTHNLQYPKRTDERLACQ